MNKKTRMVSKIGEFGKIFRVEKPGSKKILFTFRFIMFDPRKRFVGTDEAKDLFRKQMRISKKKMKEEFCSIYATSTTVGRGKNKHIEFNKSTKTAVNVIFIVPTKYRYMATKDIEKLEF